MKRLLVALVLLLAVRADAAPIGSITSTITVLCDGVGTGTTRLGTVPVTGLPSYATQAWVASIGDWFDLVPATGASPQALVLVTSADGSRQWRRRSVPNRQFLAATYWSVSASTGSDENVGWGMTEAAADAHPLASMLELNRRLAGWSEDNTAAGLTAVGLSVHLMDDCQTAACAAILTNVQPHSGLKFIRVRGTLTPVDGGASNLTLAAYQPAVPASNTEREITITGIGLVPTYVGKIIQTVDGTKTATVTRQNSSNHLSISQVRDQYGGIRGDGSNVTDFTVGDHVTVYDASKLAIWPFPASGVIYPILAQVRLDVGTSGMDPLSNLGAPSGVALISQCILGSGIFGTIEYDLYGGNTFIAASMIYSTHADSFTNGVSQWASVGVITAGDGPLLDNYSLVFGDEVSFVAFSPSFGGLGIRNIGTGPVTLSVADTGSIASFGMAGPTVDLLNTHNGFSGDFIGSDSQGAKSLWYGSGNTGLMLCIGKGSHSKFPISGYTVATSAAHPFNFAGKCNSDIGYHFYDVADLPFVDLSTGTTMLDSNPATTGGAF